jgi:methylated-DNA-[protein]-cysteine S-methyltransferase
METCLLSKGKSAAPRVRATRAVPLPYGWASAVVSDGRLVAVAWEDAPENLLRSLVERFPGHCPIDPREEDAGRFLLAYAKGGPISPGSVLMLSIAWERVRPFDRDVLRETARIPFGSTATYGEIARRAGRPGAARAAGGALSRNPWPVVVPCHRIVGGDGRLVGFGKGIGAKETLLAFEKGKRRAEPGAQ